MPENDVPVVISGAGPNGLMLGCELALAGVRSVVLERLPAPSDEPKANGLVGQVIRLLDMRGLHAPMSGSPEPPQPMHEWMFSGMKVPLAGVEHNPMYALMMQQPALVRALVARAADVGVDVRWGHELTDMRQSDDGVVVVVSSGDESYELHASYLVGADGGRSTVRKRAGVGFPGHTSDTMARVGHVTLPDGVRTAAGGVDIPGFGELPWGHTRLDNGAFIFVEFERGRPLVGTIEFGAPTAEELGEMSVAELRGSARRVLGVDLPIEPPSGEGPHALRRIVGQNTRQADRYRVGNVLLLGDAAHVHSGMGGPGLNLGLQDAFNLGWKLAATVNGWAPPWLLDSYEAERHPVGRRVMMQSMSQTALMAPGPEVGALRELFAELLRQPQAAAHLAHLLAGSDVSYDMGREGGDHPMVGRLVPDLTLEDGTRVADLLHAARPVLIAPGARDVARGWSDRVDAVSAAVADASVDAILLRPDGYVAWATADLTPDDVDAPRTAIRHWFGQESVALMHTVT